jgi:hypothetical protein
MIACCSRVPAVSLSKTSSSPQYHPDFSTNNVFVDDDLNVACIIDWACTASVPKSMLLCPGLPHSRNETQPYLAESFAEGFIEGQGFDGQQTLLRTARFSDSLLA